MANVLSATHMYVHALWCEYVMNAIMALIKVAVWYAEGLVYLMLIIVKNAQFRKKM